MKEEDAVHQELVQSAWDDITGEEVDRKEVKKNFSAVEHNNVLYVIGGGTEE